jgi:hypothetical protein
VSHPDVDSASLLAADIALVEPNYDSEKNIDFYIDTCLKQKVQCIIPGESSLISILKNKHLFEENGVKILSSAGLDHLDIVRSKKKTYQYFIDNDLMPEVPENYLVTNIDEFTDACAKLSNNGHQICFKPDISQGGFGFRIIDNENISRNIISGYPGVRNSMDYYLSNLSKLAKFPTLLVSQYVEGMEYTIDCLGLNSKLKFCAIRSKKNNFREIILDESIFQFARDLQSHFSFSFLFNFQIRYSNNRCFLLEINPRQAAGSYVYELEGYFLLAKCIDHLMYDNPINELTIKPFKFQSIETYIKM